MLLLLFEEVLQERFGYDLVRDVPVLTPTHRGPLGTVELNIELQRLLQKKLFHFDVSNGESGHRPHLYPGDPDKERLRSRRHEWGHGHCGRYSPAVA
jgi:exodeoxyribonuclease V alpha subunit